MPSDTIFCYGHGCNLKSSCLRNTAKVFGRQNYFNSIPYIEELNTCEYFLPNQPSIDEIQILAYQLSEVEGFPIGRDLEFWLKAEKFIIQSRENLL